ncbi:hypothetical protein [Alistipes sp.]|uniref:hypothetical protein n=1 Tax=Alistipes sp. TaxID=1872444 RepID=UPI003AEF95F4
MKSPKCQLRCIDTAERREELFVTAEIVFRQVAQQRMRVDVQIVFFIYAPYLVRNPVKIPFRVVFQERLFAEIRFKVAVARHIGLPGDAPCPPDAVRQVRRPDGASARAGLVLKHPGIEGRFAGEMRNNRTDITAYLFQMRFRAGELEAAHVVQFVGDGEQGGEEPDAVSVCGVESRIVKREIGRCAFPQHMRSEQADPRDLHAVLFQRPEKTGDLFGGLSRFDEDLRPEEGIIRMLPGRRYRGREQDRNDQQQLFHGSRSILSVQYRRPASTASRSFCTGRMRKR